MSFEAQSPAHCGIASLRYALSLLGHGLRNNEELEEADVREAFGKTKLAVLAAGVDEREIVGAAKKLGLQARMIRRRKSDPAAFVEELRKRTARGHPCLVTLHDDDRNHFHWICVAGFSDDGRQAFVFDGALLDADEPAEVFDHLDEDQKHVPGLMKRSRLEAWLRPVCEDCEGDGEDDDGESCGTCGGSGEFDPEDAQFGIELWPADDKRRRFVPGRVDLQLFRDMRRDDELYRYFDEYLDDLRDIFAVGAPGDRAAHACDFLAAHEQALVRTCRGWTLPEAVDDESIRLELKALQALCRCYDFRVPKGGEREVLLSLGFYLGFRSAERAYEVGRYA